MKWIAALLLLSSPACAHDRWADGSPVPAWVKAACCGPEDVHHLRPEQVRLTPEGYLVEGYPRSSRQGRPCPLPTVTIGYSIRSWEPGCSPQSTASSRRLRALDDG